MEVDRKIECWKEKQSQGRIARANNINHRLSNQHLVNLRISDNLVKFVVKARLQLLECNTILHLYDPATWQKQCSRCGFRSETVSHIINGCSYNKSAIQKRHNRIAEIITRNVAEVNLGATVLHDQHVTPSHFVEGRDEAFVDVRHTRPDACFINCAEKSCLMVEVSVPFDSFVDDCYQSKFNKYLLLCQKINELGYSCKVVVLIVGSLGNVHSRFVSGLKLCGLPASRARGVASFCSVSAMIGSNMIWKQRCRATA